MAGSKWTKRDTSSGLANTGGDAETTEFVKVLESENVAAVSVSISIDGLATERCKWITKSHKPGSLDWENGTYTWHWRIGDTSTALLNISEVILRRLSSDGATVRASKSSGMLTLQTLDADRTGTIDWNDGTQNPASRTADDRFELVFRINNTAVVATTGSVNTNQNVAQDETVTPIVCEASLTETTTVTETLQRFARKFRSMIETENITETINKTKRLLRSMSEDVTIADAVERFTRKFRHIVENITVTELVERLTRHFRHMSENVTITDSVEKQRMVPRIIEETVTITDAVQRFARKLREIVDTTTITETLARKVTFVRFIEETIGSTQVITAAIAEGFMIFFGKRRN